MAADGFVAGLVHRRSRTYAPVSLARRPEGCGLDGNPADRSYLCFRWSDVNGLGSPIRLSHKALVGKFMTETWPNQNHVWRAYGLAMSAVVRLELVLKVACVGEEYRRAQSKSPDEIDKIGPKLVTEIPRLKYSTAVQRFIRLHGDKLSEDERETFRLTVKTRNKLVHHFLFDSVPLLFSQEGVEALQAECEFYHQAFTAGVHRVIQIAGRDVELFLHSTRAAAEATK